MSVTFVTTFHPVRSGIDPYLKKFDEIATTGVPIVLFLDTEVSFPRSYSNVKVVPATLDTSWIPHDVSLPAIRSLEKDTVRYLVLMLKKLKYMVEALDHCNTPYMAWIDFGISHVIRYPGTTFQKLVALASFSKPDLNTILIPGCWGPNPAHDIWNSVYWRFCGGFFLGPRNVFPLAYTRQTELVEQNLPKLTWEVNYWTRMEEFFTFYPADHNDTMIMSMPYSRGIQRLTNDSYYLGGHRKVAVGGPIEQYVYSRCGPRVFPVFIKTDMLVNHSEFVRMRSTMDWQDPAIHDVDTIRSQIQEVSGMRPVLCVDTAKLIVDSDVLLLPTDDTTFSRGLVFPYIPPPWETRKDSVVWRGAASGCEYPSLRLRTVQALKSNPHADVWFTRGSWPQNDAKIPDAYFGQSTTIEEQLAHKYILSIDGNGAASNIEWVLASGAVPIFVIDAGVRFWFKDLLKDGINCVLVEDPQTLPERLETLRMKDSEAREIAQNALELSKRIFSPDFQRAYIDIQLNRIIL